MLTRVHCRTLLIAAVAVLGVQASDALAQNKSSDTPCLPGKPCGVAAPVNTTKPAAKPVHRATRAKRAEGYHAISPGFRMLPGGGSRVFVQLNHPVEPKLIKTSGQLIYLLPGFHVPVHNSKHSLQTQYFSTPVADARLVQTKEEVRLTIALRANAEPKVQLVETEHGKAWELQIDFPSGNWPVETRDPIHRGHHHHHKQGRQDAADSSYVAPSTPSPAPVQHQPATNSGSGGVLGPPTP